MIQRIQSLYLLLTTLFSVLFLNGSFLKLIDSEGSRIIVNFTGIYKASGDKGFDLIEKLLPLSVIFILIPVISVLAIFLYRNRKLQFKITLILILVSIVLILISTYYGISIVNSYHASFVPGIKMFIPFLILVFAILAYRGIKKDEALVKSYDRIR
jgi:Domain of unknown function (DUF4293)